jgi:hypothetical protein
MAFVHVYIRLQHSVGGQPCLVHDQAESRLTRRADVSVGQHQAIDLHR